jgi:hypothetical protein
VLCGCIPVVAVHFCWAPCFSWPRRLSARPLRGRSVLMLFAGDKDSPALARFQVGLRARMEQELKAPVWIYDESFDEGWLGHSPSYERTMEGFLRAKYAKRGIDIVVPVGDYPLQFMQRKRQTLPEAKLIYLCWRSPQVSVPDATGLVLRTNLAPTLESALNQNPGTRQVLLITGASALDQGFAQLFLASGQNICKRRTSKSSLKSFRPERSMTPVPR